MAEGSGRESCNIRRARGNIGSLPGLVDHVTNIMSFKGSALLRFKDLDSVYSLIRPKALLLSTMT